MEGTDSDYVAKHDLETIFGELLKALSHAHPEEPLLPAIAALQHLYDQRAQGEAVSNYFDNFLSVLQEKDSKKKTFSKAPFSPSLPHHHHDDDDNDVFGNFSWTTATNDGASTAPTASTNTATTSTAASLSGDKQQKALVQQALAEATTSDGWSEAQMDLAAKKVSAGSIAATRPRRYSISAEPYTPSESRPFPRVVIKKDDATRARIERAVEGTLLFRNLDAEPMHRIVDAMFEKRVPRSVELIRQGDEGDYFYVVASGRFVVIKDGQEILTYGEGDTFGELALMYGSPRMATIRALEDSVVWAVDRATFRGIVIDLAFKKRRLYESFLRSVPLLKSLHDHEIYRICDALQPVAYEAGQVIVAQGDPAHEFFIIEEGSAVTTIKDSNPSHPSQSLPVSHLHAGDYFGELAFLKDAPRAATVTATTPIRCLTLSKADFIRLLGPVMPILQRNQEHYKSFEDLSSSCTTAK